MPDQRQEVRIVVYGIIGQLCLLVQRNLKIFANFDFLLIETYLSGSLGSSSAIALHKNQPVATIRPSDFNQQGHIKYNRLGMCTMIVLCDEPLGSLQDARMDHFVQGGQLTFIGKD